MNALLVSCGEFELRIAIDLTRGHTFCEKCAKVAPPFVNLATRLRDGA